MISCRCTCVDSILNASVPTPDSQRYDKRTAGLLAIDLAGLRLKEPIYITCMISESRAFHFPATIILNYTTTTLGNNNN